MPVLKEYRCKAHGPVEAYSPFCVYCGHGKFLVQEIRTPPAYRRPNMKFIDSTLRTIAKDAGLTDLKNDVQGRVSVLESVKKTNDVEKPRWLGIEHAAPGFSRQANASVPKVNAESMGFVPTTANEVLKNLPAPRTQIVARYKGD